MAQRIKTAALLLLGRAGKQGAGVPAGMETPAVTEDPEDPEDRVDPGESRAALMNYTAPNAAEKIPTREAAFARTA